MSEEQRDERKNLETEKRGNHADGVTGGEKGNDLPSGSSPAESTPHPFEELLDEYPLREPIEDPVWSIRIVKGWIYFLAFNFAWMLLFLIIGVFVQ